MVKKQVVHFTLSFLFIMVFVVAFTFIVHGETQEGVLYSATYSKGITNDMLAGDYTDENIAALKNANTYSEAALTASSTEYHIAIQSTGYVFYNSSNQLKNTYYVKDRISEIWIFNEIKSGVYVIKSKLDDSVCLTADPTTKTVSLSTYVSGNTNQQWSMYLSSSGNALQTASTNSAISGMKVLLSNGTFTLSSSSYTPVGFIDVSWFVPCESISVSDVDVSYNPSLNIVSKISFSPSNSTCNGTNWLTFSYGDKSVCTVDTSGTLKGVNYGRGTITVKHKITRKSVTFTAHVVSVKNVYIL